MRRATISLPTPVSPTMRTFASDRAAAFKSSRSRSISGLRPSRRGGVADRVRSGVMTAIGVLLVSLKRSKFYRLRQTKFNRQDRYRRIKSYHRTKLGSLTRQEGHIAACNVAHLRDVFCLREDNRPSQKRILA